MTSLPNAAPPSGRQDYAQFVDLHAEEFTRYVRRVLDRSAEGRGGRVGVEDTLQEAFLRIHHRWSELSVLEDGERDRLMYRCLRDAAARALRQEYGSRARKSPRPQVIAYDFAALEVGDGDRPFHERELTAAVLGGMVRDVAGDDAASPVLGRALLLAGLRALTKEEAVVVIAVDHLGWNQERLAEHLGVGFSTMRETLRVGRKLLAMTIRHGAGVEVDDQDQSQLAAFRAGELKGAERRLVARHLARCRACQVLDVQRQAFGQGAAQVLVPLPFVAVGDVLLKGSVIKAAPATAPGGAGLFALPGAAKVTTVVMSLLVAGGATAAVLAAVSQQGGPAPLPPAVATAPSGFPLQGGMRRVESPVVTKKPVVRHRPKHRKTPQRETSSHTEPNRQAATTSQATTPTVRQGHTPSTSSSSSGCEFFCG